MSLRDLSAADVPPSLLMLSLRNENGDVVVLREVGAVRACGVEAEVLAAKAALSGRRRGVE